MRKEDYIHYRSTRNTGEIMYEFYKEGFNPEKHKPFLTKQEFYIAMNQWEDGGYGNIYLPSVFAYYDSKFEVSYLKNAEGHILRAI